MLWHTQTSHHLHRPSLSYLRCLKPFVTVDHWQYIQEWTEGKKSHFQAFTKTSIYTSYTAKVMRYLECMKLRAKIPCSLNSGCGPSFHWFVWVRKDLSRSTGFKLATLPAVMSFKVGELYKKINLLSWLALQRSGTHARKQEDKGNFRLIALQL